MKSILRVFAPAPEIERLPEDKIPKTYNRFRWRILESTFFGYATFYLVRNNLPLISKEMGTDLQYTDSMVGDLFLATAIAYGVGKFIMGILSDRSNPRVFMATGLAITAIINLIFGNATNHTVHIILWALNGLAQGMGWPPCGRSLGHWFSAKERGVYFAIWNTAHNVGGFAIALLAPFVASLYGWQYAFYVPAAIAAIGSIYIFARLRDTPQSVGLPPIEEYKPQDYQDIVITKDAERERSTYELVVNDVLKNPIIWIFALSNFFVYIVRYGLISWGPTYLKATKGADLTSGGMSTFLFEFAGIFSTILMGWISDKVSGRRGMVSLLCLLPISVSLFGIYSTPDGYLWLDLILFSVIGFFIYPPIMMLGVAGLDFTSKKAVGTAAGFIGLFGYAGSALQGKMLGVLADSEYGWDSALLFLGVSLIFAILLLTFTWNLKPKQ